MSICIYIYIHKYIHKCTYIYIHIYTYLYIEPNNTKTRSTIDKGTRRRIFFVSSFLRLFFSPFCCSSIAIAIAIRIPLSFQNTCHGLAQMLKRLHKYIREKLSTQFPAQMMTDCTPKGVGLWKATMAG